MQYLGGKTYTDARALVLLVVVLNESLLKDTKFYKVKMYYRDRLIHGPQVL